MESVMLNTSFNNSMIDSANSQYYSYVTGVPTWEYPNWYYPIVQEYYPVYYGYYNSNQDKHEKAFKVAKLLIEKEIVDIKKVKDFIELIESIFKIM